MLTFMIRDHSLTVLFWYLACCYCRAVGVLQDEAEAVRWYRLAADQGFAEAQYNLG